MVLLALSNGINLWGQNTTENYFKPDIAFFPKTPDGAAFSKYIDIPASTHTGVVNVSVPIYSFNFDGQNFPISLEYNTSGIRLDEIASRVGLGWTLNIGGVSLSKQVMGSPDDLSSGKSDVSMGFQPNGIGTVGDTYKALLAIGYFQGEPPVDFLPDIYSYSLLNNSGKFILDYKTQKALTIPSTPIDIKRDYSRGFTIKDDKGYEYHFTNWQRSYSDNSCTNTVSLNPPLDEYIIYYIKSPNNQLVSFEYIDSPIRTYNTSVVQKKILSSEIAPHYLRLPIIPENCYNSVREIGIPIIKKIKFTGGEVEFNYSEDTRKDITNDKYVKSIIIRNSNDIIRNYELNIGGEKGYFTSNSIYNETESYSYRLKLSGVSELIKGENYTFQYYDGNLSPRLSNSKDIWGVYNGKNNTSSLATSSYYNFQFNRFDTFNSGNILSADITYGKIGNLQKITYPTGGTQEIIYENDEFLATNSGYYYHLYKSLGIISDGIGKAGTLRVSKIILDDNKGEKIIKKFNYINPKTGKTSGLNYGTFNLSSVKKDVVITSMEYVNPPRRFYNYATNNPGWQLSTIGGKAVGYSHVQEVVENYKDSSKNYKTVYEYFFDPDSFEADWTSYNSNSLVNMSYPIFNPERGLLRKKEYYNNDNKLIKKDSLVYNFDSYFNRNSSIALNQQMLYRGVEIALSNKICAGNCIFEFEYFPFEIRTYWIQNKKTISTEYFPNGNVVTTTENIYNPDYKHLYPTNTITTTSKNETITTEYQYPPDLVGQEDYMTELKEANRISEPVVVKQKVDGTYISEVHNQYNLFSGIIQKSAVHQKRGNGINIKTSIADRKITYDSYDTKGNLTQYTLENGIPVTIIWGYGGQYPVAKIEGAALSQISNATILNLNTKTTDSELLTAITALRTAHKDAMITGYLYKPLVGVTQIIQPNGMTEKYHYDAANRLKSIVNDQNEVIKTFEYNYKQP